MTVCVFFLFESACESIFVYKSVLLTVHVCVGQVEEGWWEGYLNGKIGMFPSNFTKEFQTESDTPPSDTPTSQDELHNNRTSKAQKKHTHNCISFALCIHCVCVCVCR